MADDEEKKTILSCAAGVLERLTAIEGQQKSIREKLEGHMNREEKTQAEIKWITRLVFASMLGIIIQQWAPWT
jgi:hypothetical protein